MSKPTVELAQELKAWLRKAVILQDQGEPVAEVLSTVIDLSSVHMLMVEADNERLRMVHEGMDVRKRPEGGGAFLGFDPVPTNI